MARSDMAAPNQKELAYRRARQLHTRSKLTPQEVADLAGMSLNTVKKVLIGTARSTDSEAHINSILRVERTLEQYMETLQQGRLDEKALILSGDLSRDVVILAKSLAVMMQELVIDPDKAQAVDLTVLGRSIVSCKNNLEVISSQ